MSHRSVRNPVSASEPRTLQDLAALLQKRRRGAALWMMSLSTMNRIREPM
jgi:hypothetical protein